MMTQGEVWFVKFTGQGYEYQNTRPAVVIESDNQLKVTSVITIVPITKQQNKHRDDIFIARNGLNNLSFDSLIKVHQIQTFDPSRFIKKIGHVEKDVMNQIKDYLRRHFAL